MHPLLRTILPLCLAAFFAPLAFAAQPPAAVQPADPRSLSHSPAAAAQKAADPRADSAQTLVNGRAAVLPAEHFSAPDAWRSGTAAVLYPLLAPAADPRQPSHSEATTATQFADPSQPSHSAADPRDDTATQFADPSQPSHSEAAADPRDDTATQFADPRQPSHSEAAADPRDDAATTPAAAAAQPAPRTKKLLILAPNYRAAGSHFAATIDGRAQKFAVAAGDYAAEAITVAPAFAAKKPAPALAARIKKEAAEAAAVYANSPKKSYIRRRFVAPLRSSVTSPFGRARTFNGQLRSYHSGTDFRAAPGTPVPAANDGVVALSADRYYAGGSVIIDHGHGVFTQYYHLSRRDVAAGERVARGQIVGLSGASGRVSGPHLHLGVAIRGVSVDPLAFFEAINAFLPED